jgi:hypothetical protein
MLTLLSAGVGVQVGRSAVAEIAPVHRVQRELPAVPAAREVRTSSGSGCADCNAYPVDYRPERDPQVEALYGDPAPEGAGKLPVEGAAAPVPVPTPGETADPAEQP